MPAVVGSYLTLARFARTGRVRAAVLVDYTEFNVRLGRRLRRLGIRVMGCVAPQVWAWRAGRLRTAGRSFDRLAVILPFEETLWRNAGVDARYVGHPVVDASPRGRAEARSRLGIAPDRDAVALLPGSRAHEVRSLAENMLRALREVERGGRSVDARIVVAPSLDERTRRWLRERAARARVPTIDVAPDAGAYEWLGAFDAALAASGTAALESALAGAHPVIVYRVSALTAAIARRLIRVHSIGLPNVLLGSRAYPELVQNDVEPLRMASALGELLDHRASFDEKSNDLRRILVPPASRLRTTPERIAAWMGDWLGHADDERAQATPSDAAEAP
jgi:lipid-A-disaccharide synthase